MWVPLPGVAKGFFSQSQLPVQTLSWQNDPDFLRATAVTREVERIPK